jgi:hypothetical protein
MQLARSGPDGSFRLPVLPGRHTVRASGKGYGPASLNDVDVFPGGEVPVRLELDPGALLVLEVRGPDGEIPRDVYAIAVAPGKFGEDAVYGTAMGSAGRIELDTLPRGAVVVTVRAKGYAAKILELVLPGPPVLQVALNRGGGLRLVVPGLDPDVQGVASAYRPTGSPDVPVGAAALTGEITVLTNLPAGPVRVRVQTASGQMFEASATIVHGQTVEAVAAPAVQ